MASMHSSPPINGSRPDVEDGLSDAPTPLWHSQKAPHLANTWETWSPKARRNVLLRGDLRYYQWLILESDPDVTQICEQPGMTALQAEGRSNRPFDFWYRTQSGDELLLDTFYRKRLIDSEPGSPLAVQLESRTAYAAHFARRYAIATDTLLLQFPQYLSNWSFILRHLATARDGGDLELRARLVRCLQLKGTQSLADLEAVVPIDPEVLRAAIFWEIHAGRVSSELRLNPISRRTCFAAVP